MSKKNNGLIAAFIICLIIIACLFGYIFFFTVKIDPSNVDVDRPVKVDESEITILTKEKALDLMEDVFTEDEMIYIYRAIDGNSFTMTVGPSYFNYWTMKIKVSSLDVNALVTVKFNATKNSDFEWAIQEYYWENNRG